MHKNLLIFLLFFSLGDTKLAAETTDFAQLSQRNAWLSHPVLGEASFDHFEHAPNNPILRGKAPLDWPVNGFLFEDPVSRNWYAYVGHYARGYNAQTASSLCTVSRSTDQGKTWKHLGKVFPNQVHRYEGEEADEDRAPDVSVVYANGRYHMVYDWVTEHSTWSNIHHPDHTANSGVGYAWAERPEGPFHRSTTPVATTRDQPLLLGKYRRQYASTLIQRKNDWLVLTLTDSHQYYGWAYMGRVASQPEGPYSVGKMLLHPEGDTYHPPLLEFHPSFVHEGFVYAPATSVARNRNVQALFRAPLEEAMNPKAWSLYQMGSLWHAEPLEHEHMGIWGQAFSGFIDANHIFNVLYPSRDSKGYGTINLAHRFWDKPFRRQGFVVSAHGGPSMALLKRQGVPERFEANLKTKGVVHLFWGADMPLGANQPTSDAMLHPLTQRSYHALELTNEGWRLLHVAKSGESEVFAEGKRALKGDAPIAINWRDTGEATLRFGNTVQWQGALPPTSGAFGLLLKPNSRAEVNHFTVSGKLTESTRRFLWTDALLGAAQNMKNWKKIKSDQFLYGEGVVSKNGGVAAKWSVVGERITIYAPSGPNFGVADVFIDGKNRGTIDYRATTPTASKPLFRVKGLANAGHAIRIVPQTGLIPVDVLEVRQ